MTREPAWVKRAAEWRAQARICREQAQIAAGDHRRSLLRSAEVCDLAATSWDAAACIEEMAE